MPAGLDDRRQETAEELGRENIAGDEGAFVLCSFWLVDNLALQGRLEEAEQLYASLCARAGPLGLDNVVITPHAAYYSDEAIRTVRDFAAHEVARVLTGQPPLSPVNAAQLAMARPRYPA